MCVCVCVWYLPVPNYFFFKKTEKCRQECEDDDMTEKEIDNELASIITQQAYILQRKGDIKSAQKLYDSILESK